VNGTLMLEKIGKTLKFTNMFMAASGCVSDSPFNPQNTCNVASAAE
jgi:hypothetical protein